MIISVTFNKPTLRLFNFPQTIILKGDRIGRPSGDLGRDLGSETVYANKPGPLKAILFSRGKEVPACRTASKARFEPCVLRGKYVSESSHKKSGQRLGEKIRTGHHVDKIEAARRQLARRFCPAWLPSNELVPSRK